MNSLSVARSLLVAATLGATAISCATPPRDRAWLRSAVEERTGQQVRESSTEPLPDTVNLADGLDADEAVAIALWRNPGLQSELTALETALADFDEARRPANPRLNFLAPLDVRQLAAIFLIPIDAIWQMPYRVEAAGLELERVSESMLQIVLNTERDVRTQHATALFAVQSIAIRAQVAEAWREAAALAEARARGGDIALAEADAIHAEQIIAEDAAQRARAEALMQRARLRALLALPQDIDFASLELIPTANLHATSLGAEDAMIEGALLHRAEAKAAELAIHSAAARANWARSQVVSLLLSVDGQAPVHGLAPNWSLGVQGDLPIFSLNNGNIGRSDAAVLRATARYGQVRLDVAMEIVSARAALERAQRSREAYAQVVEFLRNAGEAASSAFESGAESYLVVIDALRRNVEARLRLLEFEAEHSRAQADLARAVGGRMYLEMQ